MSNRRSNKDVKVAQVTDANASEELDSEVQAQSQNSPDSPETPDAPDSPETSEAQAMASAHISEESADAQASASQSEAQQGETEQDAAEAEPETESNDTSEPVAASVEHADDAPIELPAATLPEELALQVEVALMTTDRALPAAKLSDLLGKAGVKAINEAVASLNEVYEQTGRSFRIEQVANGLQILSLPKYAGVMELLHKTRSAGRLTPAAMETLAIIAYKQPILRVQIEAIRGVASGEMIRSLMERRLVRIVGRSEEIGRPMLYGTTKTFLETFGLSNLKDLPKTEDFASGKGL